MTIPSPNATLIDVHPNDAAQLIACMVYKGRKQPMMHVSELAKAVTQTELASTLNEKETQHAVLGIVLEAAIPLHQNYRGFYHNADSTIMENQHKSLFGKIKDSAINITENAEIKIKGKHSPDYQRNVTTTEKLIELIQTEKNKQEIFTAPIKGIPIKRTPSLADILEASEQAQRSKPTRSLKY